ncbi:hypothetical protein Lbir_0854 [Legionella birminghamensis]|uniref:Ankyrin repeat-containing protein n=1 Tax=Legionella birminghamensis TaxID=28083 RepID=A0A378IA33_9GAMM|nr:hypothetical protein [Legionella birminghamensis]KTC74389.1 hypothetical protein Lbir_0854 [Legionella birminghamensis]STX31696.1 Uncharacterised protein [Legionella birminghamensis]
MRSKHPAYTNLYDKNHAITMIDLILRERNTKRIHDKNRISDTLAAISAKYALEGKSDHFEDVINAIIRKGELLSQKKDPFNEPQQVSDREIDDFIQEVLCAYLFQESNKKHNIEDPVLNLEVPPAQSAPQPEGDLTAADAPVKLQRVYHLGMAAGKEDWATIFNNMRTPDTAWTVRTHHHTVTISVNKDGDFQVYNPSDNKFSVFKDSEENTAAALLSNYLFSEAFRFDSHEPIPLAINVMAHPQSTITHNFPDKEQIIQDIKRNHPEHVNRQNDPYSNPLVIAVAQNDIESLEAWLINGSNKSYLALEVAASKNNLEAMTILLDEKHRKYLSAGERSLSSIYAASIRNALRAGQLDAFEKLINDNHIRATFEELQQSNPKAYENYQLETLKAAVFSNDAECIHAVVAYLDKAVPGIDIAKLIKPHKDKYQGTDLGDQGFKILDALISPQNEQEQHQGTNQAALDADQQSTAPQTQEEIKEYVSKLPSFTQIMQSLWEGIKKGFSTLVNSFKSCLQENVEQQEPAKPQLETTQNFRSRVSEIRGDEEAEHHDKDKSQALSRK